MDGIDPEWTQGRLETVNDRRRANRHQLLFNARVYDADSGRLIGHLSNLSTDGVMVITERPLPMGRTHRMRIPLPVAFEGRNELEIEAAVAWTQPAMHPTYHRNGLRALSLGQDQRRVLTRLVEDYDLRIDGEPVPAA